MLAAYKYVTSVKFQQKEEKYELMKTPNDKYACFLQGGK